MESVDNGLTLAERLWIVGFPFSAINATEILSYSTLPKWSTERYILEYTVYPLARQSVTHSMKCFCLICSIANTEISDRDTEYR